MEVDRRAGNGAYYKDKGHRNKYETIQDPDADHLHTSDTGAVYLLPESSTSSAGPRDSLHANNPRTDLPVQHKAYILVPGIGIILLAGILGYLAWNVCKQNDQIIELTHEILLMKKENPGDDCSDYFVSRDDWGAREPKPACCTELNTPLPNVFIKYSAFEQCDTKPVCSKLSRDIQDYHMDIRGWDDTGFNFLIGEDGNVYVGRGWTNQGAHTLGKNNIGYGVAILGDFKVDIPHDKAMNALYDFIRCGIAEGYIQSNYTALGNTTALQSAWDQTLARRTGRSSGAEMMVNPKPLLYAFAFFLTLLPFYYK